MSRIGIFVGSVFGNAENLACDVEQTLTSKGHQVTLYDNAELTDIVDGNNDTVLIVTSTTGQGELPDTLANLHQQLNDTLPQLPQLSYGLITLGDSSYQNFCGAGDKVEALFQQMAMVELYPRLNIDAGVDFDPQPPALDWLEKLNTKLI
ncbi:flavodoxin [Vibrio sp. SS-MA-C1-2]|uniref:flavodoxin n=1 Tax=Vibrio sp. SS-MA-C1-2 TaxID=2908646 RepID=UPI001F16FACB|nr:flavodoxin [Vibrio sp. SS-MA-C1-2]UJF18906.1 flavodoxin [Vibrio sp. SS-MA-C1-2]